MGGLRWTHKATRNLAATLTQRGIDISYVTVGRLLREMKYSLRTNRKRLAKTNDPDRDRQFCLLAQRRNRFEREKWPVPERSAGSIRYAASGQPVKFRGDCAAPQLNPHV